MYVGATDLRLSTTHGSFSPVDNALLLESDSIPFTLVTDRVAQENNETFSFELSYMPLSALGTNATFINTVEGTIVDGDGLKLFSIHIKIYSLI